LELGSKKLTPKMSKNKEKISILQIIAWIIGFIGLSILVYGIIRALII
jgi:hypothetical protein